jgi:hypothetical protein
MQVAKGHDGQALWKRCSQYIQYFLCPVETSGLCLRVAIALALKSTSIVQQSRNFIDIIVSPVFMAEFAEK